MQFVLLCFILFVSVAPCHLHIGAETKWLPICKQHFQMHFPEWKCVNFDWSMFPVVQLTMIRHRRRKWLGAGQPTSMSLSEPMLGSLLTHICVARPQWATGTQREHRPIPINNKLRAAVCSIYGTCHMLCFPGLIPGDTSKSSVRGRVKQENPTSWHTDKKLPPDENSGSSLHEDLADGQPLDIQDSSPRCLSIL